MTLKNMNHKSVYLLGEQPLLVSPRLAVALGMHESMFIQQLHYWLQKSQHIFHDRQWVYNSYKQWLEQFPFMSDSTLRRLIKSLKSQKIIDMQVVRDAKGNCTSWYTLNYDILDKIFEKHIDTTWSARTNPPGPTDQDPLVPLTTSYTETTDRDYRTDIPPYPPRGNGVPKPKTKKPSKRDNILGGAEHFQKSQKFDKASSGLKIDEFVRINNEVHGTEFKPTKKDLQNFDALIKMYPPEKIREKMELLRELITSAYESNDKYLIRKSFSPSTLFNMDAVLSRKVIRGMGGEKFEKAIDTHSFFED